MMNGWTASAWGGSGMMIGVVFLLVAVVALLVATRWGRAGSNSRRVVHHHTANVSSKPGTLEGELAETDDVLPGVPQ